MPYEVYLYKRGKQANWHQTHDAVRIPKRSNTDRICFTADVLCGTRRDFHTDGEAGKMNEYVYKTCLNCALSRPWKNGAMCEREGWKTILDEPCTAWKERRTENEKNNIPRKADR